MKTTLALALAFGFLASQALATTTTHICKQGNNQRRVEISTEDSGKGPCSVKYYKDTEEQGAQGKELWTAKNDSNYCLTKGDDFLKKLSDGGWTCSNDSTAKTAEKSEPAKTQEKAATEQPKAATPAEGK